MRIASTVSFSSKGTLIIDATLASGAVWRAKFQVGKKANIYYRGPLAADFSFSGNGKKAQEQIAEIMKAHRS